jgi:hypothetical protein
MKERLPVARFDDMIVLPAAGRRNCFAHEPDPAGLENPFQYGGTENTEKNSGF